MEKATIEALEAIEEDALNQVYGDKLDWQHIGLSDFMFWAKHIQTESKDYDPMKFDVLSAMGLFEMWLKNDGHEIKGSWNII